ncbi:Polyisoprenoid-binding protein YceI [Granulicella rosea]|uniref:Polyisoprenoid-binding protein YceI n=1 Tax=Granulicella rosea TaxID=474952 RepID=A0A239GXK2_9BACT|nr:YceI family protein [Granulicella rosea]SNS73498.1 Polyisoprenoid-binding protein YceI [Granulicella rosea]
MKIRTALLALAGATLLSAPAFAQTSAWTIDTAHSSVEFTIRHMGVSNVHGSLGGVKGTVLLDEKNLTKSSVEATIETKTVSTGVDARDTHLKSPDFFDIANNPTMSFKSTGVTNAGGKLQLVGLLTISGVTKPVTLDLDGPAPAQKGQGGKTISGFSASGVLHRTDFKFGPKFSAPILGDDVKFTIDIEMDKQ